MIKRWMFYIGIVSVVALISSAFKPIEATSYVPSLDPNFELLYQFPSQNPIDYSSLSLPFKGKRFVGFKEAIAFKESQGKYQLINSLGYMGKYQFGVSALKAIGINDTNKFLHTPELQEKAFVALVQINKWKLRRTIKKYRGKIVDGIRITESGILAAAHLGGAGSVKKFLESDGQKKCKDNYGTTIKSYLSQFGGYEIHNIKPDANPKVVD